MVGRESSVLPHAPERIGEPPRALSRSFACPSLRTPVASRRAGAPMPSASCRPIRTGTARSPARCARGLTKRKIRNASSTDAAPMFSARGATSAAAPTKTAARARSRARGRPRLAAGSGAQRRGPVLHAVEGVVEAPWRLRGRRFVGVASLAGQPALRPNRACRAGDQHPTPCAAAWVCRRRVRTHAPGLSPLGRPAVSGDLAWRISRERQCRRRSSGPESHDSAPAKRDDRSRSLEGHAARRPDNPDLHVHAAPRTEEHSSDGEQQRPSERAYPYKACGFECFLEFRDSWA
jgi:hypothetical protein